MATPEGKLKAKIKRRLLKQGLLYGVKVRVDFPSSSQYGTQGRPDVYVDFGNIHFRIEVKAKANARLSPTQSVWHEAHADNHFFIPVFVILGEEHMEEWFGGFGKRLITMTDMYEQGIKHMRDRILKDATPVHK